MLRFLIKFILKRLKLFADPEWLRAIQTNLIQFKDSDAKSSNKTELVEAFLHAVFAACRPS
jgi:hypothetical protein